MGAKSLYTGYSIGDCVHPTSTDDEPPSPLYAPPNGATMANDTHKQNDNEFRTALGDVRPIKQDRVAPYRRRRKPVPEQKRLDDRAVMDSLLQSELDAAELETGEELLFSRPGIQHG